MKSVLLITFGPFAPYLKNSGEEAARMMVNKGRTHGRYWLTRDSYPPTATVDPASARGAATLDLARRSEADAILILGMKPRARGFETVIRLEDIDARDLEPNGSDQPHVMCLIDQMRKALKAQPTICPDIPWLVAYVPCTPECVADRHGFEAAGHLIATNEQLVEHIVGLLDVTVHPWVLASP